MPEKNPYANADGSVKSGMGKEYLEWAREKELERRKNLPDKEVEKLEEAEKALAKRMDS